MALTATIYKAELQLADLDRHHYATYPLTLAQHPSETEERLMVRLLAFALNADEALSFGRGVSNEDEPALWQRELNGDVSHWIELGQPDPERLRRACAKAARVTVYTYGRAAPIWWRQQQKHLDRLSKLSVVSLADQDTVSLTTLVQRTMQLHCTIEDGEVTLGDSDNSFTLQPQTLL